MDKISAMQDVHEQIKLRVDAEIIASIAFDKGFDAGWELGRKDFSNVMDFGYKLGLLIKISDKEIRQ